MRDKARTLARENCRAVRGKGTQRGASFPGTAEHPLRRKQVFAAALKRVNSETRQKRTLAFHATVAGDPLRRLLLAAEGEEPFGLLHAFGESA